MNSTASFPACFLPTASGDSPETLAAFYRAMAHHDCRPTDLTLFPRTVADIPALLAEQDVIWVWGGSTLNLLSSFYAMSPKFTGGVRVDYTFARGKGDIVVAAGKSGGPQVETFDGSTLALLGSFFAYSPTFTGGVMV